MIDVWKFFRQFAIEVEQLISDCFCPPEIAPDLPHIQPTRPLAIQVI